MYSILWFTDIFGILWVSYDLILQYVDKIENINDLIDIPIGNYVEYNDRLYINHVQLKKIYLSALEDSKFRLYILLKYIIRNIKN